MKEFELIGRFFEPLAGADGYGLNLKDDAAVIPIGDGYELVITKDAIVEGVHFFPDTPPAKVAHRLLATNLSDIAAMGAAPLYYLTAAVLPKNTEDSWFEEFSTMLSEFQKEYGISLVGGDTVRHDGNLILSLTMIGKAKENESLKRSGAKDGDLIFASGTIGDAALGLIILQDKLKIDISKNSADFLVSRYEFPTPRIALGQKLVGIATSVVDISDGLFADLGHICTCSGKGALIYRDQIPLSDGAVEVLEKDSSLFEKILAGGDDYELLFTAPSERKNDIEKISATLSLRITEIGEIVYGDRVVLLGKDGIEIFTEKHGYSHF